MLAVTDVRACVVSEGDSPGKEASLIWLLEIPDVTVIFAANHTARIKRWEDYIRYKRDIVCPRGLYLEDY
jgi:hypothetical protein